MVRYPALLPAALLLTACAEQLVPGEPVLPQLAEIGCLVECRKDREACDADARDQWRQCEAGHGAEFSAYRWCQASAVDRRADCGYPWWSCAENAYRDCREQLQVCENACRAGARPPVTP